jgi:hypothetical protein
MCALRELPQEYETTRGLSCVRGLVRIEIIFRARGDGVNQR